eukprot:2530271-Amphidinium_carterae.1
MRRARALLQAMKAKLEAAHTASGNLKFRSSHTHHRKSQRIAGIPRSGARIGALRTSPKK